MGSLHLSRCNIVVKHMLFGKSPDAFEKEIFEGVHTAKEHEVWRKRGAVGKWHNIAVVSSQAFDFIASTYQVVGSKQIEYMDRHAQESSGR